MWYICGDAAAATRNGYAYVLSENNTADDDFYSDVRVKLRDLGLFEHGSGFTKYSQSDSCDYTWPTAGLRF